MRPSLPPPLPGQPSQHVIRAFRTHPGSEFAPEAQRAIAHESATDAHVPVPPILDRPHELVRQV
jgi:hypothetical protein